MNDDSTEQLVHRTEVSRVASLNSDSLLFLMFPCSVFAFLILVTGDQEQPEPRVATVQSLAHFPVQLRRGQEVKGD